MLRGGRKDLEFDACANSSMESEWTNPSNETLSSNSKSICKGGRRKQSKPVKMLISDGDEMEADGGVVDDFSLLLEIKEEPKEEENGSFIGKERHKFCSAREMIVMPSEKNSTELTGSFLKESRVICHRRSDRKLDEGRLDSGKSGASLETEGTSAGRGCGARTSDPCEGVEFKRWSEERRDSMFNGPSWSRRSRSVVDGETNILEERCLNGDRPRVASGNGGERNVTEALTAERNEVTGRMHIMEVVRTTDNKAKVTVTTPYNEQSETDRETTTFGTTNKKGCKTTQASKRKGIDIVKNEYSKSMMTSSKETSKTMEISNREASKSMEISNREPNKTIEISNREASKTMEISIREPNKTQDISNREASKTMEISNREASKKTTKISNREHSETIEISKREAKETTMTLEKDAHKREDNCSTDLIKTENIRLSSDCFHSNTATNLASQRSEIHSDAIGNANGNEVTNTLTDYLKSSIHSQLMGKLHQSSNTLQSITREPKNADSCKTSMRQCIQEDYCDICQKRFCNKYYLKKHRQDVHGLVSTAVEVTRSVRGPTKSGTDDADIQAFRFGTDSPTGCSGSVCSSEAIPLDKTLESDERASFSSSSTSTPLLNYLVFGNADVPPQRTLPSAMHGLHHERFKFSTLFGSSESNRSDMCQSNFTNALSLITNGLQSAPGLGFLDAYLRLCRDIGGSFNGKSDWEHDIYKRHERDSAVLSQSLADFQTNAFVKFQDNYLAIAKARKGAAQCEAMDGSGTSYGGIFPLGGKHSFDFFSSSFARRNDDYASEVMSKLLKAEQFLSSGAESVKTVSGFAAGKGSDRVVCDLCGKEVCNKYFLKTHKTRVHGWQEGTSSEPRDRSMGLGPFSSTLSYLVDGISSSKHDAGGNLATKPRFRRRPAEETQSTDFFSKDSQRNDLFNGFCTKENTKTISAADTIDCQSTLNGSPYNPFWSNTSSSAIHPLDEVDRSESLFGQSKWKEADVTSRITCRLCNKVVSNKHFLRTHMKRRHGIGGSKGEAKLTEFDRNFQSSVESVNSASKIGEDPQAKVSKASTNFFWFANQSKNDDEENFVNYDDAGLGVFGQRFRRQNPDKNGLRSTCPRDEEGEKSSSESEVFSSLSVTRDSGTKTQTGNSANLEQMFPSMIRDNSMNVQDGKTSIYATADCRSVLRRDSVMRNRERGDSTMRLSPGADMLSMDTHELDQKPSSLCSRDGHNVMDRIRCFLCRKRFRSSVQFNIHVRKVHASVLPNPQDSYGTTVPGKPEIDGRRCEPNTRWKQRMVPDVSLAILEGGRNSKCEASSPRVESPAAGVGRGERTSMQPFLLREMTGLDLFCPAVVYLPSLRTITNPTSVTFTLTPMIQEELGQFT